MTSLRKLGHVPVVHSLAPVHSPAAVRSASDSLRSWSWRCAGVSLLAMAALCSGATRAVAQSDSAAARALFAEGRSLMDDERYAEACPKFEESLRLDHGMGTQFNLAHCWEKLGRTASAWALFLDVAAAAKAGNQQQREAAARERAKALEPRLTRLRIDMPNAPSEAKVERDGQDVGKAAWGMAVPVDPGSHVVRVSAPGKAPWSDQIEVPATSRTFSVTVPTLTDAAAPAPVTPIETGSANPPPVEADVDSSRGGGSNGQSVAALVVGGVGLAAVATGTIFALQSRSDNNAALELCRDDDGMGGQGCRDDNEQRRHSELVDDAERERLIGFVGLGVGGAALITAVILYATADSSSGHAAVDVAPLFTGDVRGATLTARF
ncbi:MAG TPA: PEGA domain-containing protein [Polyangiaceae bacterium]|nr:PEGA domain-containing protein [Polyangiaceae bacterium]